MTIYRSINAVGYEHSGSSNRNGYQHPDCYRYTNANEDCERHRNPAANRHGHGQADEHPNTHIHHFNSGFRDSHINSCRHIRIRRNGYFRSASLR